MNPQLDRRSLLAGVTSLSLGAAMASAAQATPVAQDALPAAFSISLAQWSLHRAHFSGAMQNLDFPAVARERFDIDAIEYVNAFFKDKATDFRYLRELEARCAAVNVKSLLIMIDGEGELGHPENSERAKAVQNHFRWIAAASFLGCHSIRVNAGGAGAPEEVQKRAADSLHQLGSYGDAYNCNVIVENHGGHSSNGSWLAGVMKLANHPRVGTLPDFGNFHIANGEWYDRYKGVAELMPYAKAVSAKSHEFNEAGEEVHTDYRRMLKIVTDAGYHGYVGIEYEGDKHPEDDGIRKTKELLLRVRG